MIIKSLTIIANENYFILIHLQIYDYKMLTLYSIVIFFNVWTAP